MLKSFSIFKSILLLGLTLALAACDSGGGSDGGSTGPQTVLVIGDSISGDYNYPGVPPWPTLMAGMVPEWTVINKAVGGAKMVDGRAKIGSLITQYNPDTVVIFYGSNNAITSSTAFYESDLQSTIQTCKNAGVNKVLVCNVPYMYGSRSIYNGKVDIVNAGVTTASSAEGVAVVPVNQEFGMDSEDLFPDGLHPNLDGQNIIAMSVRERI
ncbi:GDSL-type esterase/lipase family protein [Kiritimatiellota bacterium B12222]|nr:GDSL-type esterase/lipase family protein [Kiritimatiellota bacterium B12222]